ncbi:MAG: substrate-binding domain-containing protein [Planctomycetes bacterium]|nr:substrate-binding domain-containing protein [Planctomycetota bacterium]
MPRLGRPVQPDAAYRRVADDLRRRLQTREWPPPEPLPSLRTLASEYGVSLDVLRSAMDVMRAEDRVGLSGLRRLAATREMSVKAHLTPSRAVLLLTTSPLRLDAGTTDQNRLLMGIQQGLADRDAPVIAVHSYTFRTTPPQGFLDLPLRAVLVVGALEPAGYPAYERLPIPVILVDRPAGRHALHATAVDNEGAVREAVWRLKAAGHRRIALLRRVSGAERDIDPDSKEREVAFRRVMKDAGLAVRKDSVFSSFSMDSAERPAIRALAGPAGRFSAVLCSDSAGAALLVEAARRSGRKVPEHLSVAGFQGITGAPKVSGPAIDFFDLGRRAAELLDAPRRPPKVLRVAAAWREAGTIGAPQS